MKVYTVEYDEGYLGGYAHTLYGIYKTKELAEKKMFEKAITWLDNPSIKEAKNNGFEVIEWEIEE